MRESKWESKWEKVRRLVEAGRLIDCFLFRLFLYPSMLYGNSHIEN